VVTIARAELGDDAIPDHERLADAVAEPSRREEGADVYPGVVPKAAALLLAMLRLRPFARSNARVSLLATTVFLNRNGLDLNAVPDEIIPVVAVAATGELTVLETAAALERFVVRLAHPTE
jgi:prophage maintenance system killer protein